MNKKERDELKLLLFTLGVKPNQLEIVVKHLEERVKEQAEKAANEVMGN